MLVKELAYAKPVLYSQFLLDFFMGNLGQSFNLNFFSLDLNRRELGQIFVRLINSICHLIS